MKKQLRKDLLRKRLTKSNQILVGTNIIKKLMERKIIKDDLTIGCYRAIKGEINIDEIFNVSNIRICFPKVVNGSLVFIEVSSKSDFITGTFDVLEPISLKEVNHIDVILIPGIAFNKKKYRLGYGKGYYDKYLHDLHCFKVGICFDEFVIDDSFEEQHDVKMDMIISEDSIYV